MSLVFGWVVRRYDESAQLSEVVSLAAEWATLSVRASQVALTRARSRRSAQDLVQMQPRLSAPAEVAVQNRWAMASC